MLDRRVATGRLGKTGEERDFGYRKVSDILSKVVFGGGLDAIGFIAQEDLVEVEAEKFPLGEPGFQSAGQDRLSYLSGEFSGGARAVALFRDNEGLGDLLSYGRTPLNDAARFQVCERSPEDAQVIDTVVDKEAIVL